MTRNAAILACCFTVALAVGPPVVRGDAVDALFAETAKSTEETAQAPTHISEAAAEVAQPSSPHVGVIGIGAAVDPLPHTLDASAEPAGADTPFSAVPEPSAIILALAAFVYFLLFARRRRI